MAGLGFKFPSAQGIGLAGGAVSDLFAAEGYRSKAEGNRQESAHYLRAAGLAEQNAAFTRESTAIQSTQLQRQVFQGLGSIEASVAGSGLAEGGSALDVLRSSAQQGALQDAVLKRQGLISEQGYKEQANSYRDMSESALRAAHDAENAAKGSTATGILKGVGAIASMISLV